MEEGVPSAERVGGLPPELGGEERHVLLNEDLHQVDVAAGRRSMQGGPQLVVLGVHIRPVGEQQLDDLFKVVNAALGGTQRQSEARRGPELPCCK